MQTLGEFEKKNDCVRAWCVYNCISPLVYLNDNNLSHKQRTQHSLTMTAYQWYIVISNVKHMLPCCHLKKVLVLATSPIFVEEMKKSSFNTQVLDLLSDVDVCGPSLFVSELMCQSSASSTGDCSSILSRFISLPYLGSIYCGVTDCKLF